MIKLSKKISRTIELEFGSDYTVVKCLDMRSIYKALNVYLIVFRIGQSRTLTILRYFGDNSYSFLGSNFLPDEVAGELANQIKKIY